MERSKLSGITYAGMNYLITVRLKCQLYTAHVFIFMVNCLYFMVAVIYCAVHMLFLQSMHPRSS